MSATEKECKRKITKATTMKRKNNRKKKNK